MPKKHLLFLCTGNSARSQLAEAIFNHYSQGEIQAISAGTEPTEIDPRVFEVLDQLGISHQGLRSKSQAEITEQTFDYVITLCDHAKEECALFSTDIGQIHWSLADPKLSHGIKPFQEAAQELIERIKLFLMLNQSTTDYLKDVTLLFKSMSDPTRLKILMLLEDEEVLTVTDFVTAIGESQPKISRNLAVLRDSTFLKDNKQGLWVHYSLNPELPVWIKHLLKTVRLGNPKIINNEKNNLKT